MRPDFIENWYGMSRQGKTTRALEKHPRGPRSICYTSQFTNELMVSRYKNSFIYDDPQSIQNLEAYLLKYKDICIIKRNENNNVFPTLQKIQNCEILLDDITTLIDDPYEVVRLVATVGMNNNHLQITTHVPRGDMPKKIRTIAVRVNLVGPWNSKEDIKWMYDNLRNISVEYGEFEAKAKSLKWGEVYTIKA